MTWEPRGGWAQTPPARLLETLELLAACGDVPGLERPAASAYRHAALLLKSALIAEYAP